MIVSLTPNTPVDGVQNLLLSVAPTSILETSSRRHTRVATLDGESSIIDMGYSASDSDMTFIFNSISREDNDLLLLLLQNSPLVVASVESGIYEGIISTMTPGTDPLRVTFRIKRKLNE